MCRELCSDLGQYLGSKEQEFNKEEIEDTVKTEPVSEVELPEEKRGRGRPRKCQIVETNNLPELTPSKKKRGRPRKTVNSDDNPVVIPQFPTKNDRLDPGLDHCEDFSNFSEPGDYDQRDDVLGDGDKDLAETNGLVKQNEDEMLFKTKVEETDLQLVEKPSLKKENIEPNIQCSSCDKKFSKRKFLLKHRIKVHSDVDSDPEEEIPCQECDKTVRTVAQLRRHKHYVHRKKISTCDQCGKDCPSMNALKQHIRRTHNQVNGLHCDQCSKSYIRVTKLKNHIEKEHINAEKCPFCEKSFPMNSRKFASHLFNFHGAERENPIYIMIQKNVDRARGKHYQCQECGLSFLTKTGLGSHSNKKHSRQETTYPCSECKKSFISDLKLQHHLDYEHSEKGFLCSECGAEFKANSNLKKHVKLYHGDGTSETEFACSECDRVFIQVAKLRVHIRKVHMKIKSIPCNQCEKFFFNSEQLKSHIITMHTKIRPFVCEICGYKSSKLVNLNLHRRKQHEIPENMTVKMLKTMLLYHDHPFCSPEDYLMLFITIKDGKLNIPTSLDSVQNAQVF